MGQIQVTTIILMPKFSKYFEGQGACPGTPTTQGQGKMPTTQSILPTTQTHFDWAEWILQYVKHIKDHEMFLQDKSSIEHNRQLL